MDELNGGADFWNSCVTGSCIMAWFMVGAREGTCIVGAEKLWSLIADCRLLIGAGWIIPPGELSDQLCCCTNWLSLAYANPETVNSAVPVPVKSTGVQLILVLPQTGKSWKIWLTECTKSWKILLVYALQSTVLLDCVQWKSWFLTI